MKIETRKTHSFIELYVEETDISVFKGSNIEIQQIIENLQSVIEDLTDYLTEN